MKLRIHANSVRLRLREDEVARVAGGDSISEQTRFPNGVFSYRLAIGGDEISARVHRAGSIEVILPAADATAWASSADVSMRRLIEVDGEQLTVLIEKDLQRNRD